MEQLISVDRVAAFVAGASGAYALGLGLGIAPPLVGGEETRDWGRQNWSPQAGKVMDKLDADWRYFLFRPKLTNRNFVQSQKEETRVTVVNYMSLLTGDMRGVVRFGRKPETASEETQYICGGHVSAAADQLLGFFAISSLLSLAVTANLSVTMHEPIPLGTEASFICRIDEFSRFKKIIVTVDFISLAPEDKSKIYATVSGVFVNALLPAALRSML